MQLTGLVRRGGACLFARMISQAVARLRRSGWKELVLLLVAGAFCLSLWAFIELADDAPEGDYAETETRIMRAFREPDDPAKPIGPWWLQEMARDITALGGATVITLMTTFVFGYLLLRRRYGAAVLVLVSIVGGYVLSSWLKDLFERPRPTVVPHLMQVMSHSFPSGHSMVASVAYVTLGALLARTVARRREKIYFIALAFALAFLIGVSRVYLGVHYPTDVLAGWSAGTAWALLCWSTAYWLQRRGSLKRAAEPDEEPANATEVD